MTSTEPSAFGLLLRKFRTAAELTQEELAERARVSARVVSDLERGVNRTPRMSTALQLSEALDLSDDDRDRFLAAARSRPRPVDIAQEDESASPDTTPVKTFLFADVRGYTRFTHEHGDEAAADLVATFVALVREGVEARGGKVTEVQGDQALVVFSSVRQALRAAAELQERFARHVEHDPARPLQVGMGIDVGEPVPVEGGYRGEVLNVAARLCSLAGRGEVLASESVAHLARKVEGLAYVERGPIELKGLVQPVRVVQVVPASAATEEQTMLSPVAPARREPVLPIGGFLGSLPSGPMVGRDEELAAILTAVDMVEEGTGQLLLLAGQRGVGKTRLAQEATLAAYKRGFLLATGRCYQREQPVPYFPFLEALPMAYAAAPSNLQSETLQRRPHLAALVSDAIPAPQAGAAEEQQRLFRAVATFLSALAQERPVALMLDDLHWADDASLRLLSYLARHTRGQRILLLGTYRDTELSRGQDLDHVLRDLARERLAERVAVRRLPTEGTSAMIAATIGDMESTEEFTEFVHRRTKGVPLFIEEMLRSLGGHYRLIREIGAGGMGRVFQAVDTRTGESVAAKIMFSSKDAGPDAALRFEQEGAVLANLEHPNIVKVYGTFMQEHASFIVMELLEGQSLAEVLRHPEGTRPLDLARAKWIAQQVTAALIAAHDKGIVHRDIKPDNVMVLEGDYVKVTDFGIARVLRPEATIHTMTSTGMTLGTPLYMAPEQIEGRKVDGRADVYALGAVLYQMVTGRPPFEGADTLTIAFKHVSEAPQPPSRLNHELPGDWEALILKALAKDPADRYQSASAMELAISELTTEGRAAAPAQPSNARGRTPLGRSRLRVLTPQPRHVAGEGGTTNGALAVQDPPIERPALRHGIALPSDTSGQSGATIARTSGQRRPAAPLGMTQRLKRRGVYAVLAFALIAALAVFAYTHRSQSSPRLILGRSVAGWGSTRPYSFKWPTDLAVDAHGIIYVADEFNSTVQRLSPDAIALAPLGTHGNAPGHFQLPVAVTLDRQGNIYVADGANGRIQKLSPDGRFLAQWHVADQPSALAIDRHGNIYAAGSNGIDELSTAGKQLARWPQFGPVIAADSYGAIYALNGANGHHMKLAALGKTVAMPVVFDAPRALGGVSDLAIDRQGDILVADQGRARIRIFSPSGRLLRQWGSPGRAPGQFAGLQALSVDGQGNVYTAETGNDRVQKFSPSGLPLAHWGPEVSALCLADPSATAIDADGNVLVTDPLDNRLVKLSPSGGVLAIWGGHGEFSGPYGVAVDKHGDIYLTEQLGNRLDKLSPAGALLWRVNSGSGASFSAPAGVGVDTHGQVYVADTGNNRIAVFSSSGHYLTSWGVQGSNPGQFQNPYGVAVDSSGRLYVADAANNRIQQFSPSGTPLHQWGTTGPGAGGTAPGQFHYPLGVAVDGFGDIYVADTSNNRIQEFTPDGHVLATMGTRGSHTGQFAGPAGIAVDSHGTVYVADTGNNRVQKIMLSR